MPKPDSFTQIHDPVTMRAASRVGRVLREKWTLDRLLGIGGMAAVYAATHRNGKRGAIKMLHTELSADAQIRERFLKEGRAANHVGHPGAVSVLDDDVAEDGSIFLVMDLLEGESLENRRERAGGKLDAVDVLSVIDQLLDVLAAAHAKGIVHRDLKPDNLFVTREGSVKVLDFGIAKLREATSSNATHTGISMGTPSFMAQEQARALWAEVDGRTDLWAVGATMFTCLTGRVVHEGRTANEQLLAAMTKGAPPVRTLAADVPSVLAAVVDRALAFERTDRYPDASEMQRALRLAYETMQSAPISTAPRLVVPEVAIQKTIPSASALDAFQDAPTGVVGAVRTGQPIVSGSTGSPLQRTVFGQRAVWGVGAAGVLIAAIGITAVLSRTSKTSEVPSPGTSVSLQRDVVSSASAAVATPASSSSGPMATPAVSIDSLPSTPSESTAKEKRKPPKVADPPRTPVRPPKPAATPNPMDTL